MNEEYISKVFKAFCDPIRIKIINILKECDCDDTKCACHIQDILNLSQSKLSYHMKILCDANIINCEYKGKWSHYTLNDKGFNEVINLVEGLRK